VLVSFVGGVLALAVSSPRGGLYGPQPIEPTSLPDSVSWRFLPSPTSEPITQIHFIRPDKGWILANSRRLFEYDGDGWTDITPPTSQDIFPFHIVNEKDIWCASYEYGTYTYQIHRYRNGKWQGAVPVPERVLAFSFSSPESGWAVGENGLILRYANRRWQSITSPTLLHVRQVLALSSEEAWAVAEYRGRGSVLYFDGTRWADVTPFPVGELGLLAFHSPTEGWAGGLGGLLRYQDSQWSRIDLQQVSRSRAEDVRLHELILLPGGRLLVWFQGGTAMIYDRTTWTPFKLPPGLKAVAVVPSSSSPMFVGIKSPDSQSHQETNGRQRPRGFRESLFSRQLHNFGVAVGDLSGDGLADLYFVNTEAENVLLEGGTYINRAEEANLLAPIYDSEGTNFYDSGVVLGDVDNDGDLDLYLTSLFLPNKLYMNLGKFRFRDVTERAGVGGEAYSRSNSACFGDVDNDGDLDLFVANLHASNKLYINNGTGRFRDGTSEAGLETVRGGVGATFGDVDNDGDLDLFVAIWGGPNLLYENLGPDPQTGLPRFVENAERRGVVDPQEAKRSQGAVFGDIDNDGDLDLFVTNVLTTNRLYRNDGRGNFTDITEIAGVSDSARSYSANLFDADNDGDLDLFVTNKGRNVFYLNRGDGTFLDLTEKYGFNGDAFSVGSATGDLDGDGDIDLVIANYNVPSIRMTNAHDQTDFLKLKLIGVASNRDGVGARAYLYPAGRLGQKEQLLAMREVYAGSGYYSMSSTEIHFGVDDSRRYDALVTFPSGISRALRNLEPGQSLTVHELTGWAERRVRLIQTLRRWAFTPKVQQRAAEVAALAIVVLAVQWGARRREWWNSKSRHTLFFFPAAAYVGTTLILHDRAGLLAAAITYATTLFALVWTLRSARRAGLSTASEKYREELLLACLAFEHGEWASKTLTRLQFLIGNLEPDQRISDTVSERILVAISDYHDLLAKELNHITGVAQMAGLKEVASVLRHQQIRLSDRLGDAKVGLLLGRGLSQKMIQEILKLVDGLREQIRLMRSQTGASLYCRLRPTLEGMVREHRKGSNVAIDVRPEAIPDLWVRIRTPEFVAIIDNLFSNAVAAMQADGMRQIRITVLCDIDTVTLEFSDSGRGIPPELWEKIFEPGFSTSTEGHTGFGLYFARETLRKYGGSIRVKTSAPGEGTTFEIRLRRFDHE
jgi:signal transduction histidine kinase